MPVNIGPARVLGAEVAAGAILFEVLSLDASYTYSRRALSRATAAGRVAFAQVERGFPHVPEHAPRARPRSSSGAVRLFADVRYESEVFIPGRSRRGSPAATQVDAGDHVVPAQIPGLGFFPARWSVTGPGSEPDRRAALRLARLPLPKDPMWLVRVRGADAVNLAGALLAVTLTVSPAGDTLELFTLFPPALETHPTNADRAFVGISSNGPGVFQLRIAPAQSLDYVDPSYALPSNLSCSGQPFNVPNVGGFTLERTAARRAAGSRRRAASSSCRSTTRPAAS